MKRQDLYTLLNGFEFEKDLCKLLDKYGYEKTDSIQKLIIKCYSGQKRPLICVRCTGTKTSRKLIKKSIKYKFETDLLNILEECKYRTDNVQTLEIQCEVEKRPTIKLGYYQF